jgi:hypothetical protein
MRSNRLLLLAVGLITLGLLGIFLTAQFGRLYGFGGSMMPMMSGGMMGGRMNQEQMRQMMQEMMGGLLPPGINPEDLPVPQSEGARLLTRFCAQCHNLPSPAMHTAEEWPVVVQRMIARMTMMARMSGIGMMRMMPQIDAPSARQQDTILSYLQNHALRSVVPDTLPSPESPEARAFQNICTQCHGLPDPTLHTAGEWPAVVERMRTNMRSMGKRVITEEEKKDVISYLTRNARE